MTERKPEGLSRWPWPAVAAFLILAPFAAADTVTLKDDVYVKGPKISLGDVAQVEGENANVLAAIEITAAAVPGGAKQVTAGLVESQLRNSGYDTGQLRVEGARAVRATTMHLEVSREMIAEDLRRFIETEMPWAPDQAMVDVELPMQNLCVPKGELRIVWKPNPQYRYIGPATFRGEVCVDGAMQTMVLCRATVDAYQDVVVASKDIPRGKPIGLDDLEVETWAVSALPRGVFSDPKELAGNVAKSAIFAGEVLTERKIAPKQIVKRNQMVTVEVRQGAVVVCDRAKALQNGCAGEVVNCMNITSKEQFQGVVREDGVIIPE